MATELQRIGVKFFCTSGQDIDLLDFIPVLHRWIQEGFGDDVLVDVADYSHVPEGPGVLLVCHEGIYAVDETGGRRGVVYYLRRPTETDPAECLAKAMRRVLSACEKLEAEPEFAGKLALDGAALEVFVNDRLRAPNEDATLEALRPAVTAVLGRLYPGATLELTREPDARQRFSLNVSGGEPAAVSTLLGRVAA